MSKGAMSNNVKPEVIVYSIDKNIINYVDEPIDYVKNQERRFS